MAQLVKLEVYITMKDFQKLLNTDFNNHELVLANNDTYEEIEIIEIGQYSGPYEGKPVEAL